MKVRCLRVACLLDDVPVELDLYQADAVKALCEAYATDDEGDNDNEDEAAGEDARSDNDDSDREDRPGEIGDDSDREDQETASEEPEECGEDETGATKLDLNDEALEAPEYVFADTWGDDSDPRWEPVLVRDCSKPRESQAHERTYVNL